MLDPAIHKFGTSVNVSNMMKTILMSMVELYISCANHTQQLTIHDTFKRVKNDDDLDTISEIADKCRLLANHLKKVDNSRKLLHGECSMSNHNPKAIPVDNGGKIEVGKRAVRVTETFCNGEAERADAGAYREGAERRALYSQPNLLFCPEGYK